MSSSYEKIAFVWNEPKEKIAVPDRCVFKKVIPELENSFKHKQSLRNYDAQAASS